MPGPYSTDLRQRVVDAYLADEGSTRQLAERFKVSNGTVCLWTQQFKQRGSVQPLPSRGRETFWQEPQRKALLELVQAKTDATMAQVAEQLGAKLGRFFHPQMISRGLKRIGWTRKKKTFTPASATLRRSKPSA